MKKPQESIKDYVHESHSAVSGHSLRAAVSQCLAALATNLVKFAFGSFYGITTILVAELYKKNAEIEISLSGLTWFSSTCFMIPVGSIVMGILAQKIGPRRCLLLTSLLFIISGIMFYFAKSAAMLLCAQALAGLAAPAVIGPGTTYIVEISEPYLRSPLVASTNLSMIIGVFVTILYSNWLHWRTIVLINLSSPIIGFLAIYMIPESPHWLASKGKLDEAERSLSWVRGWTKSENISREFNSLKETYKIPDRDPTKDSYKTTLKRYSNRSFYLPLAVVTCMFISHACTGFMAIVAYLMIIFKDIEAPIDSHLAASLFDVMRIAGAIICIASVHSTGKRKLIFISLIGAGLSYLSIATLLIVKTHDTYASYTHIFNWASTILLIFSTLMTSTGIDKVVFMYNAELFPTKFRNVGTGIGIFVFSVGAAIVSKSYLYLVASVSLPGTFFIYGTFCFICCVIFYFLLPETEGKTLQELEDHYAKPIKCTN